MYVDMAGLAFNAIVAGVVWFLIMPWVRMIQPRAALPFKLAAGAMLLATAADFLGYGLLLGVVGAVLGTELGLWITEHINEIEHVLSRATGQEIFPRDVYYFDRIPTDVQVTDSLLRTTGNRAVVEVEPELYGCDAIQITDCQIDGLGAAQFALNVWGSGRAGTTLFRGNIIRRCQKGVQEYAGGRLIIEGNHFEASVPGPLYVDGAPGQWGPSQLQWIDNVRNGAPAGPS